MTSDKERVATLEATMKTVLDNQKEMASDIKDIKKFMIDISANMATKAELNAAIADRKTDMQNQCEDFDYKLSNVSKAKRLQTIQVSIIVSLFSLMAGYMLSNLVK